MDLDAIIAAAGNTVVEKVRTVAETVGKGCETVFRQADEFLYTQLSLIGTPRGDLLSSTEGKITEIVMSYGWPKLWSGQLNFLEQRPDIPHVTMLTAHPSDIAVMQGAVAMTTIDPKRITYLAYESQDSPAVPDCADRLNRHHFDGDWANCKPFLANFVPWTQDPFHVVRVNGRIAIARTTDPSYSGRHFSHLSALLCRDRGFTCFDSLPIEGADLFATEGWLLANALYNGAPWIGYNERVSETALTHAFGHRQVIWVGNTGQEVAHMHLDLTVTPTGRRDADGRPIAVVGDVRRAQEILGGRDDLGGYEYDWGRREAEWNRVIGVWTPYYEWMADWIRWREGPTEDEVMAQIFRAMVPPELQRIQPEGGNRYLGVMSRVFSESGPFTRQIAEQLDIYAEQLEAAGFAVRRIPYLDTHDGSDWQLPILSYNNVLVENYRDKDGTEHHVVTMPTYDIPPLDEVAQAVYEELGFVVIPVRGFVASATDAGALHCMVKVLNRTEQ